MSNSAYKRSIGLVKLGYLTDGPCRCAGCARPAARKEIISMPSHDPLDILTGTTRCTEAQRQRCVERLQAAIGDGQLRQDTGIARIEAALEAQTLDSLHRLLSDLRRETQEAVVTTRNWVLRGVIIPVGVWLAAGTAGVTLTTLGALGGGFQDNGPAGWVTAVVFGLLIDIAWPIVTAIMWAGGSFGYWRDSAKEHARRRAARINQERRNRL